jgi:hypothetical protein
VTKLPTFQQARAAQALARAKQSIERMNQPGITLPPLLTEPLPVKPFHPEAGHIWLRQFGKQFALSSDGALLLFILYAEEGDADAIQILDEVGDAYLNRGDRIPHFLATFIAKQKKGLIKPRGGNTNADKILRDFAIMALLMDQVQHCGLRFTRNLSASRRRSQQDRAPSACSVLAQALSEMDIMTIDEPTLHKIYLRWGPTVLSGWLWDAK